MESIRDQLEKRQEFLKEMETSVMKRMRSAPEGKLRISHRKGVPQYYYRKSPSERGGKYIPRGNIKLIKSLAQKEYDEKLLKASERERKAIEAYLNHCPCCTADRLFYELNDVRKDLVNPAIETDESYVKRWQEYPYVGKEFSSDTPALITDRGEKVRSKSEMIIANYLNKENIPYRYEYPVRLRGMGTVYPDFTVLNIRLRKEYYWEHFGMMDDPEYADKAVRKLSTFNSNGYYPGVNMIITFETKSVPLSGKQVKEFIQHYLK